MHIHTYTCMHSMYLGCIYILASLSNVLHQFVVVVVSTRLPRRQVPVMEYTHNIQYRNTHTAQAQQESSERLAQLSSLSSRRSLSLLFVRHCAKMGLGCCQWGVFNVKDFDFTHLTVNALLTRPTIRNVCVQISNRFKNSLKLKNVSF